MLKQLGVFDGLRDIIASTLIGKIMPVESLSMVVLSFIADYTSGFVTAGALLSQHVLTFKQGVIAILLGNIIAIPMRALRHQLPRFFWDIFTWSGDPGPCYRTAYKGYFPYSCGDYILFFVF